MTSPLRKGALVAVDPRTGGLLLAWTFQYNPETLMRQLLPQAWGGPEDERPAMLPPGGRTCEEIRISVELDAASDLDRGAAGGENGLLPALSALELLAHGTIPAGREGKPAEKPNGAAPPVLVFEWGERPRPPVRIAACAITEEAFSASLVPTRAHVDLTLEVLTYDDSPETHPGRRLFVKYLELRQGLASRYGR
jgi:hypothetical protein